MCKLLENFIYVNNILVFSCLIINCLSKFDDSEEPELIPGNSIMFYYIFRIILSKEERI